MASPEFSHTNESFLPEELTRAVVFNCEGRKTIFCTPFRREGYCFRTAAHFWTIGAPTFQHGTKGDIVSFSDLEPGDIDRIARYAGPQGNGLEYDLYDEWSLLTPEETDSLMNEAIQKLEIQEKEVRQRQAAA